MRRVRFLSVMLATVAIAGACAAQTAPAGQPLAVNGTVAPAGIRIKPIPSKTAPTPFPPGSEWPGRVKTLEYRLPDEMSEKDKLLEADAESSIQERTSWAAMDFSEGRWNYKQIVCPALPNHLLLQFTRNNGTGDVSVFSASIPRNHEGRVRIIPIQRRGYSLFSPAPINALTISAFNHIRAEEDQSKVPDWLTTGLCYAALAGARPETVLLPTLYDDAPTKFPAAQPALMEIPLRGGAIIRFADVAASPRPMVWSMIFDRKGKLLKAGHSPAQLVTAKEVAPPTDHPTAKPIPQTIVDLNAR